VEHLDPLARAAGRAAAGAVARPVARALLVGFVRHASLVRPLDEAGRLKLAGDTTRFEVATASLLQLCGPRGADARAEALGAPYRELRALKRLLFLPNAAILAAPAAAAAGPSPGSAGDGGGGEASGVLARMRPSTVWHHLFARAPAAFPSPHARAGGGGGGGGAGGEEAGRDGGGGARRRWSQARYVRWMADTDGGGAAAAKDGDGEAGDDAAYPLGGAALGSALDEAVWKRVSGCLDAYIQRRTAAAGGDPEADKAAEEAGVLVLDVFQASRETFAALQRRARG